MELVAARDGRVRVLVDGAPATRPGDLADALVDPLRALGRPVVRVRADDFLRPASVRFEHGRHDPDAYLEDRLDVGALGREVLDPFVARGRFLPTLWDPAADRATRAAYEDAPERAVLVLDGSLLLGRWLDADLTVHLTVRPSTLARRTSQEDRWTLPAFARYDEETAPAQVADVVVHVDDPRHPAVES
ncbi:uridine kinase [Cellulomonas xylanilytica]|uniref:Uridine kinase n=1 Tax=Cellulomonas xylanilytica TaxID=233583 RepID=A0A510V4D2_9CELL|nr:uridine kinase [Cellulomonas xylanilytica]GEK21742.1 uridine kinase [Cellulomonas xylanilytica]